MNSIPCRSSGRTKRLGGNVVAGVVRGLPAFPAALPQAEAAPIPGLMVARVCCMVETFCCNWWILTGGGVVLTGVTVVFLFWFWICWVMDIILYKMYICV